MKILIRVASLSMLFLLPGLSFAQSASPVEPWFSVMISTPEAIATAGSDVNLKVKFTNDTGKDLHFAVGGPGRGGPAFDINVRDSQGNAVPETSYGLRMHGRDPRPWSGSVFRATSHSGQTVEINLILSKEYDLSKPGKYTVQVQDRRPVVRPVKSNIVTITVFP
jgi:hypothetical protein